MNRRSFFSSGPSASRTAEAEQPPGWRPSFRQCALITAIPQLVFLLHATLFGTWIADDAGISFAYARNLAAGHGLVSQPGAERVEGYSNFLWVLLMSALIRIGLFHVVWTPKIVACVLTAGSFMVVTITLARAAFWGSGAAVGALTLVALQPGFVIWSVSGLENPLYVFLLCLLMSGVGHLLSATSPSWQTALLMGVVAAGVPATRPDGLIYLALVPLVLSLRALMAHGLRPCLGALVAYGTVATALLGALVAFRWLYFHDLLPNTYYAKGGSTLKRIGSIVLLLPGTILKIGGLAEAITGRLAATWLLLLVFAGTIVLIRAKRFHPSLAVLALFSGFSGAVYLLLPLDWMGEYRFASPFFLFFYTYLVTLLWSLCEITMRTGVARRTFAIVLALLLVGTTVQVARRSVGFANRPTVPLALVAELFGYRYNRVAAALGMESGSLLAPDLGGTLLYSKLAIYDLAGLCDRTIARTMGKDQQKFYDYVFGQLKPTFIHVHPPWVDLAKFDGDSRFRRDYVPIRERMVYDRSGSMRLESGHFIRLEVLRGPVQPLAAILAGESDASRDSPDTPSCCGWIR